MSNKIKDFEKEILKKLEKYHLKVYSLFDDVKVADEWFVDKEDMEKYMDENDYHKGEEEFEISISKEPHITEGVVKTTIKKTAKHYKKEVMLTMTHFTQISKKDFNKVMEVFENE